MIDVRKIVVLQEDNIIQWHNAIVESQVEIPWVFIEENNKWNFKLWHEEDIARVRNIEERRIVLAKRNIDSYNQKRNDSMEKIDEWVLNLLENEFSSDVIPLHSETPGMMIDRLSILGLKKYHMEEQTKRVDETIDHRKICSYKLSVLNEQIYDLSLCLQQVFDNLKNGTLRFKVYRQMKMYNNPTLNPEIYTRLNAEKKD